MKIALGLYIMGSLLYYDPGPMIFWPGAKYFNLSMIFGPNLKVCSDIFFGLTYYHKHSSWSSNSYILKYLQKNDLFMFYIFHQDDGF